MVSEGKHTLAVLPLYFILCSRSHGYDALAATLDTYGNTCSRLQGSAVDSGLDARLPSVRLLDPH